MKKRKSSCLLLAVIVPFIFFSNKNALGFYIEVDPKFAWLLYYEDNISGFAHTELEDFSNRYKPTLDFSINFSRLSITGKTELEIIEYIDEKDWNTVDQDHQITLAFEPDQRTALFISAGYTVESDPDRYLTRGETREEDFFETERGYLVRRYKNKSEFYSAGYSYGLSERSYLSFVFMLSSFETSVTDDTDFYAYNLDYEYILNRKTSLTLKLNYNFFDFTFSEEAEGDIEYLEDIVLGDAFELFHGSDYELNNYVISCGLDHKFRDDLWLKFSLGWRYTKTDIIRETADLETGEIISESDEDSGSGGIFSLSLQKDFLYTKINFRASQNIGTNPDSGVTYEHRRFRLQVSHDFTRRLKGNIFLSYYIHETDRDDEFGFEIDRESYSISPRISYQYNNWLTVELYYRYSKYENNIRDTEIERNTFFLQFNFSLLRPYIIS